jgi:hypothetical protein
MRVLGTVVFVKKTIIILYSECTFLALLIQDAMRHIVISGLSGFATYFHIVSKTERFWGEKVTEYKKCVLIFSATFI